jgi:hypothetical protein
VDNRRLIAWLRSGVALGLTAVIVGCHRHPATEPVEDRTAKIRVDYLVAAAKARGETSLFIQCPLVNHRQMISMRDELATDAVFVGRDIAAAPMVTTHDRSQIWTFYKFRIDRDLSRVPIRQAAGDALSLQSEAPGAMLPLQADEIVLSAPRGQMNVDGVSVTDCSARPQFVEGQRYLVFVPLENDGKQQLRTSIIWQKDAIYEVLPDGEHFKPTEPNGPPFQSELMRSVHGSLGKLAAIAAKTGN